MYLYILCIEYVYVLCIQKPFKRFIIYEIKREKKSQEQE